MLVKKASPAGTSIICSFEDLGAAASSYSIYAGDIGRWYSHTSMTCGATPVAMGGRREISMAIPEPRRYLLVTGSNTCAESGSGADSFGVAHPPINLDCPP
jgi:hypothetical protein